MEARSVAKSSVAKNPMLWLQNLSLALSPLFYMYMLFATFLFKAQALSLVRLQIVPFLIYFWLFFLFK